VTKGMGMRSLGVVALTMLAALPAAGQERVDERRPAVADGSVVIEVYSGTIRVVGWDRAEVAVTGTLGAGADALRVRGGDRKTRVEVEPSLPGGLHAHADVDVKVPAGSAVSVESFGARVDVTGVTGAVQVDTVNGSVSVTGAAREVSAESVNGSVTVRGRSGRISAESVNGAVSVSEPGADVQAGTVNGSLTVTGTRGLESARLETVNGRIRFEGGLSPRGSLDVESVSGAVELALPDTAADFRIYTFSGGIVNELGPAAPRTEHHGPGHRARELVFSTAGGGARISVRTLSGHITLAARPRGQRD
jgi:DUF4097 and DUF4098 domain-containing protein YvlB